MTVADLRAETRAFSRARLRELALDATREVVLERGWAAVRMGSIAAAVGISRQSLHAEFGTKDDLGDALVLREASRFFDGISALLNEHPGDLGGGIYAAGCYILEAPRDSALLQTILTRTTAAGDTSLLPLMTTRGEPLIGRAMETVGDWVAGQWPDLPLADARLMVESIARLAVSHILSQTQPSDAVAADLARLACRCVGFADPVIT